jgi:hypothetical protein
VAGITRSDRSAAPVIRIPVFDTPVTKFLLQYCRYNKILPRLMLKIKEERKSI